MRRLVTDKRSTAGESHRAHVATEEAERFRHRGLSPTLRNPGISRPKAIPTRGLSMFRLTSAECALVGACIVFTASSLPAQNAGGSQEEWKSLVAEKAALVEKLTGMQEKFTDATPEEQQKLAQEAQSLQKNFQQKVAARMVELAPQVYEANPKDIDAAEIMLQVNYSKMQYDKTAQVADAILVQQPEHQLALNVGGVANFANHDFEKAVGQLEAARKAEQLIPQLGGQYLDSARNYVGYWEKEQQIRQQEAAATGDQQLPRVKMTTGKGEIVVELFENEAPNTVANFISLAEKGFYDGLSFHRVIPTFMAQGGCPNTREGATGQPGTGGPGYNIKCEAYEPDARRHFAGSLSMAHAGKDTGGSQFFITHLPTPHLDQEVNPQSVHTVFGRVVEGLDVVRSLQVDDPIEQVEVIRKRNHDYKPVTQPSSR
jgi:cyclophilin family peptidyl-prolyl cis-trans isomerase